MMGCAYTELHFHLLPGIDDGPTSMEESLELAGAAASEGTRTVVATPHVQHGFVTDVRDLPEMVAELNEELRAAGIPIRVLCGGELAHPMVASLSPAELDVIAHGPAGRRWLLLEAPLQGLDQDFTSAARELRARGFSVVIAHPERALGASSSGWPVIEDELAAGSGLQINVWSLTGRYGDQVRGHALRAIRAASVVALASDAHGPTRPPVLRSGLQALAAEGITDGELLVTSIPADLLRRGLALRPFTAAA